MYRVVASEVCLKNGKKDEKMTTSSFRIFCSFVDFVVFVVLSIGAFFV